jgi:hypothetical protein
LITGKSLFEGARIFDRNRYCQALMLAGHGASVILDATGIACPAAAFGFRSPFCRRPASIRP